MARTWEPEERPESVAERRAPAAAERLVRKVVPADRRRPEPVARPEARAPAARA